VTGTAADTFTWAQEHRNALLIGVLAVACVLAIVIGAVFYRQQQTEKANVLLSRALRVQGAPLRPAGEPATPGVPSFTTTPERAQAARKAFAEVADKYGSTAPGQMARYFMAITFNDEGKYADAEKALKDAAGSSNKDVSGLSRYALAQLAVAQHKDEEAIRAYKELIDHPSAAVSKANAQLELAQLYEARNQPQEARRIYEQVQKDDPKSDAAQAATARLAGMGAAKK
jgi:TolA-binding protein